jgi:hypothetical protein
MPETALSSSGLSQLLNLHELSPDKTRENHLGNAFSTLDSKWFVPMIDDDDSYLSPVIRVDGARRIHQGYTVAKGQAAPRTYLRLTTFRKLECNPGRYENPFSGTEKNIIRDICIEIHACRIARHVRWERMLAAVRYAFNFYDVLFVHQASKRKG